MKAITAHELKAMLAGESRPTLVNTLPEKSFADTRIPGAINIPQEEDDFVDRVRKAAGGTDKSVVVYCASEQCHSSTEGARKLDAAGFSKVFDFEAGAEGWKQTQKQEAHAG